MKLTPSSWNAVEKSGKIYSRENEMKSWTQIRVIIEKNGLMILVIAILLLYWVIDILAESSLMNRVLITVLVLAYGIITQSLLNDQKRAKDSLQQAHDDLEQANKQLANVNKKLELAYASMRDNRDELRQQMYDENIGFLVDQDGKIEGVTERALSVIKKSRDVLQGAFLTNLMPENACEDFGQDLKQAWTGTSRQLKRRIIMTGEGEQEFEMKFTRLTVSGKRLLLVILN